MLWDFPRRVCILSSFFSISAILLLLWDWLALVLDGFGEGHSHCVLEEIALVAELSGSSRFIILLFLISSDSFIRLISASCWVIVLLQALRAVLLNSSSGSLLFTLEDLCLVAYEGCFCLEARLTLGWGRIPGGL